MPHHTIIVAGTGWAGIDGTTTGTSTGGVTDLRPKKFDANTGFAFHPYEPVIFTQQGFKFFSHVHGLTFPADRHPGGQQRAEDDFTRAVEADGKLTAGEKQKLIDDFIGTTRHSYSFHRYWKEFGSLQALADRLAVVTNWADARGLSRQQLMNTEFGVNRDQTSCTGFAPQQSAVTFIEAIRKISVQAKIGMITIHEAQGGCFAISDSKPPFAFDQEIISALGLKREPR